MDGISSASAISQLLGVASEFFKYYQRYRDADLVHATHKAGINTMSLVSFAIFLLEGSGGFYLANNGAEHQHVRRKPQVSAEGT